MKSINSLSINRSRFSDVVCAIAHTYGFRTIGQMKSAMTRAMPHAKWCYGTLHARTTTLLRALDSFKGDRDLPF